MDTVVTALIIAAVLLVLGTAGTYSIKKRVENLSMSMFGTKSLSEGLDRQADELALKPKSVSGMTRILEPQIQKDFPEFNWLQFRNKAEHMLLSAFSAINRGEADRLEEASSDVMEQVSAQIRKNRDEGIREVYERAKIHQTEIARYEKKQGRCIITLQSAVEYLHYAEQNGRLLSGDRERLTQTKYNTEIMYIQDPEKANMDGAVGMTCPNCGAPVTTLGVHRCEYCGLEVIPVNLQVWTLARYYEVDYKHV